MIHKTTRSILSVLLAVLLLVTSTPLTPAFAGDGGAVSLQSESGEGRVLKPVNGEYQIYTADDLKEFAAIVNGTAEGIDQNTSANAKLMNDIDLSSVCGPKLNDESSVSWTPIGNSSRYSGNFDGNGKTISGLYINDSSDNYQGLFGYVSGTVKDLGVSGSVSGPDSGTGNSVGGVVGYNSGTVKNCYNTGSVSVPDSGTGNSVGGVVGYNSGTVKNCYNTGKVSGPDSGSGSYVGGVVGWNLSSGNVENCYNTDSVNVSGSYVGGVVGLNHGSVENCYNTGEVSATGNVGGVVGYNINSTVENCYNIGEVSGGEDVGGVVGYNYSGSVTTCYNTGEVSGNSYVGGVVGRNESGGTVTGCYFLQQESEISGIGGGSPTTGATAVNDLSDQTQFQGWDFTDTWRISTDKKRPVLQANAEDNALSGTGKQEDPYKIYRAIDLKNFRDLVNGEDGQTADTDAHAHAKLMNDIDLNGSATNQWTPIGNSIDNTYEGTFNGDGHTISGLDINNSTADYQGLFGYVGTGGTVQNLSVSGTVTSSGNFVGGVVGDNGGTVKNCYNTGTVTGTGTDDYVGGVVGYNYGSVTNCYNTGSVSGPDSGTGNRVGGVVGYNISSVTNCYNTGNISGGNQVGGVVGWNSGSVKNCYNTGTVTGPDSGNSNQVGGVVGYNFSGTVENCYNIGKVSGSEYVGGVVGYNISSVTNCYFLQTETVNTQLQGIGEGSGDATAKDNTAFHSGEVAYLLQSKQSDESGLVWGQSKLKDENSWPTLIALDKNAKTVYKVITDFGYDEQPDNVSYTNNPAEPAAPSREGYTFDSWQKTTGEGNTITYTAKWTAIPATYTVTFDSQGGSAVNDQTVTEGQTITEPAAPTRDGYTFAGWFTETSGGSQWNFNDPVNKSMTLYAKWTEITPDPTPTPTPTPAGPSTGDSTGWDDIRDELENAENGDEITIDMGDETKVPAEIFESLAGKDVDVTFDLGDIQWSVNGADIPTDTDFTDLDLGVNLDTHGIPVNVINTITGEVGTVQITLAHDGEFGFTMTLTAPLGKENAGYWANLYHYKVNGGEADREDPLGDDEDAEALNFEAAAKIDEDGSVTIPFSHASQYAIVIDTHSHATVDVSDIFIDVAPNAWYKDAVQYAYDHGLMTGVSDTEFAPEATTTRAMIVSILARLEGVESAQAAGFADVDDNDWYATAVNWAANVGVVNGYEDNTFRPNQPITREQLAAILMNYAACIGEDVSNRADLTSYTDQPSAWATETMSWAVAEGLLTGVTADTLQPQGAATRAQVAAILQRFLSE